MTDRRIPKDLLILYCELACGKRGLGCPLLYFKDICEWDRKALDIDVNRWEELAGDWSLLRREPSSALKRG